MVTNDNVLDVMEKRVFAKPERISEQLQNTQPLTPSINLLLLLSHIRASLLRCHALPKSDNIHCKLDEQNCCSRSLAILKSNNSTSKSSETTAPAVAYSPSQRVIKVSFHDVF